MSLSLYITTPQGEAFDGPVRSVVLPGVTGDFGVLSGHETFLSALQAGALEIDVDDGDKRVAAISEGFAEIHGESVTVLVGRCEFADEADIDRDKVAAERARRMIEEMRATDEGEAFYQRYQEAFAEAVTPEE